MICPRCNKRDVEVTYKEYIEGIITEIGLCLKCANDLANGIRIIPEEEIISEDNLIKCQNCGFSLREFKEDFLLGCSECYDVFLPFFKEIFGRLTINTKYSGERLTPDRFMPIVEEEIKDLTEKLKELIEKEEFKEAIKVRDRIKRLEKIIKWTF